VKPFGAIGIDGKERSYKGSAGAFKEIQAANRFRDIFNYFLPSLADDPGILSKLLISDLQVQILPSPQEEGEVEKFASVITLGTPAYNAVSGYVESKIHSKGHFELGISGKSEFKNDISRMKTDSSTYTQVVSLDASLIPSGTASAFDERISDTAASKGSGFTVPGADEDQLIEKKSAILIEGIPPITEPNFGFVERIHDKDNDRKVFYVAGLSEDTTAGAANFLIERWSYLHKKYGREKDFLIMLRFEPPSYRNPTIIFER
jgi:hypothetical protein